MVGQWTVTKPSRSDEVLDADQQQQITNRVRAQFDSLAPKRPTKPNRSDPDFPTTATSNLPPAPDGDQIIPEFNKLRCLQHQSHLKISMEGNGSVQDEFVETQYYKEMDSIAKEHHTTGSGFISMVREGENGYDIELEDGHGAGNVVNRPVFKSNPATNDWIPTADDDQVFVSPKPNRSEGC